MIHHVDFAIKALLWQVSWDVCVYHRWRLPLQQAPPPELQLTVGLQEKRERNVTELQMIEDVF